MLAVLGLMLGLVLLLALIPGIIRAEIREGLLSSLWTLVGILAIYVAYEAATRHWLGRLLEQGRTPAAWWSFLNSAIEVSLPTLVTAALAAAVGSLPALAGAVPYVYFLLILTSVLGLNAVLCVFAGALSGVEFLALNLMLLRGEPAAAAASSPILSMLTSPHQYAAKCILLLAAGFAAGFVARQFRAQLTRVIATLDERDRAISIFGQHVSPQVAELLLKQQVDYAGEQRDVCIMFLDIRDFSVFANAHTAAEVVSYLNVLFEFMIPLVNRNHGVVNKFLGDGFMAVFGAPLPDTNECGNAVKASTDILARLAELNRQSAIPPTRIGIGLHVGQAATGNVGTSERKEYTIIGDVVNVASRIEQATKGLHAQLLVSHPVAEKIGQNGPAAEDMGLIELKGQPQPLRLFKLA